MRLRVDERQHIRENLKIAVYTILLKSPPARNVRIGVSLSHRPGREDEFMSESDGLQISAGAPPTVVIMQARPPSTRAPGGLCLNVNLSLSDRLGNLPDRHCKK